jgi:glycosyltransferase involved in cell wall biosynthesis
VLPFTWNHIGKSGGDSGKVFWIPNGTNLERFADLPVYSGGQIPLTAMYVGGFSVTHDISTIIRSAKILQQKGIRAFKFVIVGSGLQRKNCEKEANDLMVQNIEFRDSVPKNEIPRLQMDADVLIASVKNTPVYQFGINSNKIYDYLASARPIIFSGNAPNDPVAKTGAGFSIPPENPEAMVEALESLLSMTPEARIEMGKRGRQYVAKEYEIGMLGGRMELLLLQAIEDGKC